MPLQSDELTIPEDPVTVSVSAKVPATAGTADTQVTSDTLTCYFVRLVVWIPELDVRWGPGIAQDISVEGPVVIYYTYLHQYSINIAIN